MLIVFIYDVMCNVHAVAVQCVPCKVGSGAFHRRQQGGSEVAETGELRLHCTATALDRSPAWLQSGLASEWLGEPDCNAMASSMFVPSTTNAVNANSTEG